MSQEIITPASMEQVVEFGSFRHPETVLKEAELVASTFAKRAERLQLYKKINDSKHLLIEGWQTLAAMYRVTAGIVDDHYVEFGDARGFEATAEAIFVPTQARISSAKAMCLNDEERWGSRPTYKYINDVKTKTGETPVPLQQIRSMAQTRATSKVLSNLLKWVARMAGFAGTPAEEMTGHEDTGGESNGTITTPVRRSAGALITDKQASRIWGVGNGAGLSKEQIIAVIKRHGFETAKDVTADKYDVLIADLQKEAKPGEQQATA